MNKLLQIFDTKSLKETEYKCSQYTKASGFTPLMHVVMSNNITLAKEILLENPEQINMKNSLGFTALYLASRNSRTDSSEEMVKLLLEGGADPNIRDNDGWTPLQMAARNSNTTSTENTVKMLLEAGADPNCQESITKWTALHIAVRNSKIDSTENTVKMLLEAGADPNIKSDSGWTALHIAARNSNFGSTKNTVKMLLEAGADLNIVTNDGDTALDLSKINNDKEVIKMIRCYNISYDNMDKYFDEIEVEMIKKIVRQREEKIYKEFLMKYINQILHFIKYH